MKITQDVRDYARRKGIGDVQTAVEVGMQEKADQFRREGAEIYRKA